MNHCWRMMAMDLKILDEVAYFFVDQFDNLYGMLVDRTDVRRIRKASDDGLDAMGNVHRKGDGQQLPNGYYKKGQFIIKDDSFICSLSAYNCR